MTSADDVLVEVVATLTPVDRDAARAALDAGRSGSDRATAASTLVNLVRQAPAAHGDRMRLLDALSAVIDAADTTSLLAAGDVLRRSPPRLPERPGTVVLPPLDPILTETSPPPRWPAHRRPTGGHATRS